MHSGNTSFNVFEHSVTEIILIIAFIFLLLATIFYKNSIDVAYDKARQDKLLEQIDTLNGEINRLSKKFGLDYNDNVADQLTQMTQIINKINSVVKTNIELEEEWEQLVFSKEKVDQAAQSIEKAYLNLRQLTAEFNYNGATASDFHSRAEAIEQFSLLLAKRVNNHSTLSKNLTQCATNYEDLRERCGTGYPSCNGLNVFLADLTLENEGVEMQFNNSAAAAGIQSTSGVYSLEKFEEIADLYFDHSAVQTPECRYQVKVVDNTSIAGLYKKYMTEIEIRFYKLNIDGGVDGGG